MRNSRRSRVKFVKLVADDVGKTNMDRPQYECSSHKSEKKKKK